MTRTDQRFEMERNFMMNDKLLKILCEREEMNKNKLCAKKF